MTELAITRRGVKNYNVAVREYGEQIIFLRQIIPGGADKSYGIHVAKLAGLPPEVISRAQENLENNSIAEAGQPSLVTKSRYMIREQRQKYKKEKPESDHIQPTLFDQ